MESKTIKIIEVARELLKTQGYFVDNLWHVEDVHFICEQNGLPKITDDDAMEVYRIANDQFDGDTGLSWPKLERALHTFLHRKAILSTLCESYPT
jgi:hypothetical protein